MATPEIRFQPFVEISGSYTTGLANVGVSELGELANASSPGVVLTWGVSGFKSWRHDKVGVSYRGNLAHYTAKSSYDYIDQSMMLSAVHQFSRRVTFDIRAIGGVSSRDYGLLNLPQTVSFDPFTMFLPTTEFFDNRTYYLNSGAGLTYQRTARLSFNASADEILIRRRSKALFGTTGYTAKGDAQYRINRRSTIGVNYAYLHYGYTGNAGSTDGHAVMPSYAVQLTRWTEFSGYGGVMRVESKFLHRTAVDPAIAALLGISSTSQIVHRINYLPYAGVRLSRTFQTGVLFAGAMRMVTPGNGVFLTSYSTGISGGYNYTGMRRWSFGAVANYSQSRVIGELARGGNYNGLGAGMSVSRQISPSVHFVSNFRVRSYGSPDYEKYNRTVYEGRVGIGFTPGDMPLRIW